MRRTWRAIPALLAAAVGVAACGGGNDGEDPTVNSMVATPAAYGRTAVWTVSGLNLDRGVAFTIASGSCANLAEIGEGTAFQRQFGCRVASLGELIGQANDGGGNRLASLRLIIPKPLVRLSLSQGSVDLELEPERAPVTVDNFLDYVNSGFYNNTIFHRVVADFVVQGGGFAPGSPSPVPKPATRPAIVLESGNGLANVRGALAMARSSAPDSATSQFYINVVDNPSLDYRSDAEPGYAVFGRVAAGLDLVDAISMVPTRAVPTLGLTHLPVTDVVVTAARQLR